MSEPEWAKPENELKKPEMTLLGIPVKLDESLPPNVIIMRSTTWRDVEKYAFCSYIEMEAVKHVG